MNLVTMDMAGTSYDQTVRFTTRIFYILDADLQVSVLLGTDAQTVFELEVWDEGKRYNQPIKEPTIIRRFTMDTSIPRKIRFQ